jgi:hypothetical protein
MLNYGAATFEKQILCPSRDFTFPHSQGSNPEVRECGREVGFTPKSGHSCERPLRATSSRSRTQYGASPKGSVAKPMR